MLVIQALYQFTRPAMNLLVRSPDCPDTIETSLRPLEVTLDLQFLHDLCQGMMFPADQNVSLSLIRLQRIDKCLDIVSIDGVINGDVEMFRERNDRVEGTFASTSYSMYQ